MKKPVTRNQQTVTALIARIDAHPWVDILECLRALSKLGFRIESAEAIAGYSAIEASLGEIERKQKQCKPKKVAP